MNLEAFERHPEVLKKIAQWQEQHPYRFAFIIAMVMFCYILFYSPPLELTEEDITPTDDIVFLDIDKIQSQLARRVTRRDVSPTEGEIDPNKSDVDRAYGMTDDPNAVDLAFQPNVVPPRPIGRLMKLYPRIAREKGIEAMINVELLIASNGRVKAVRILGIRLSKALPPDIHTAIAKSFARDSITILQNVRFSPPVVQGKNVPVKFEMPLRFRLED
ncbi:MAG: energy transducer TonB [Spirochaetes bacterium]|nr:energy transducer TonB [Spirochaetota bacterium]